VQSVCDTSRQQYASRWRSWTTFRAQTNRRRWIHNLSMEDQAVELERFIAFCHHTKQNQWGTIEGKISAVRYMHKAYKRHNLVYDDPGLSMVAGGAQRTLSNPRPWHGVTIEMLRSLQGRVRKNPTGPNLVLFGGQLLSFFFLERGGEMWGKKGYALQMNDLKLFGDDGKPWTDQRGDPWQCRSDGGKTKRNLEQKCCSFAPRTWTSAL
jgi:hypothetical protein